jgi:hypothetical protein
MRDFSGCHSVCLSRLVPCPLNEQALCDGGIANRRPLLPAGF